MASSEGLSDEMKQELVGEIQRDTQRMNERLLELQHWNPANERHALPAYKDLEQLTYITEQIRLKLRLLGAPRIYQ